MAEGKKTRFTSEQVARASGTGGLESWRSAGFFPPVAPPPPVAQEVQGRQLDYPTGFNLNFAPRQEQTGQSNITFQQLRSLADGYDLLRLVIETRKDQLCALRWNIVGRETDDKIKNDDPRVKELEKFFRRPDGKLTFNEWLRVLVEDMLVIDAPCIYPRNTNGGKMHSLEVMDGATIKILIGDDGRTPAPPLPAYAQVLKGMPAVHYTTDELIYKPRNRRSWKLYGYSPVEQIIMTVNIALRRQMNQLNYYTEGNIPEALASCPPEWTPEQVERFQLGWDAVIAGQPDQKRHMKFIPGGIDVKFTREQALKDTMDEWLARIVAYAFSVSPQALVQLMNRATAESAAETAQLEGLAPLQLWVADLINDIIERKFGYDDLVFEWDGGEELDPKAQAEINKIYLECGVLDAEEIRKDLGRDPRNTEKPSGAASAPATPSAGATGSGEPGVVAAGAAPEPQLGPDGQPLPPELDEAGNPIATPVSSEAKVADAAMNGTQVSSLIEIVSLVAAKDLPEETALALIMAAFPSVPKETIEAMLTPLRNFEPPKPEPLLGPDGQPIAPGQPPTADAAQTDGDGDEVAPGVPKTKKEAPLKEKPDAEKLAKAAPPAVRAQKRILVTTLTGHLQRLGAAVAEQVASERKITVQKQLAKATNAEREIKRLLAKLNISFDDIKEQLLSALEITSTSSAGRAVKAFIKSRDAFSLANSRAEEWATNRAAELVTELTESTRDLLRGSILEAEEQGWSNEQLASELQENYAFSKQRAQTIARTELKAADSEGAIAGWRATGLKMKKEWVTSANDTCEICEGNEAQGPIDLEDTFESGDDTTPAHPNCQCIVSSVIDPEEQDL